MKYKCIKDFYMNSASGGHRAFTKDKLYTVISNKSVVDSSLCFIDDTNREHYMLFDRDLKGNFLSLEEYWNNEIKEIINE